MDGEKVGGEEEALGWCSHCRCKNHPRCGSISIITLIIIIIIIIITINRRLRVYLS